MKEESRYFLKHEASCPQAMLLMESGNGTKRELSEEKWRGSGKANLKEKAD